jgi:transposase
VRSLAPAVQLWYCPDPVARRLGFAGLFALVRHRLQADPLSGHLFLFRTKHADRLKVLAWGGYGLCLCCQRREAGRYPLPEAPADARRVALTAGPFQLLLDGSALRRVCRFKRFPPPR